MSKEINIIKEEMMGELLGRVVKIEAKIDLLIDGINMILYKLHEEEIKKGNLKISKRE